MLQCTLNSQMTDHLLTDKRKREKRSMFDAAIIGTGPAGLSAALCLALHEKEFVWFGSAAMSDKVEKSEKIANYPGMGLISGKTDY